MKTIQRTESVDEYIATHKEEIHSVKYTCKICNGGMAKGSMLWDGFRICRECFYKFGDAIDRATEDSKFKEEDELYKYDDNDYKQSKIHGDENLKKIATIVARERYAMEQMLVRCWGKEDYDFVKDILNKRHQSMIDFIANTLFKDEEVQKLYRMANK